MRAARSTWLAAPGSPSMSDHAALSEGWGVGTGNPAITGVWPAAPPPDPRMDGEAAGGAAPPVGRAVEQLGPATRAAPAPASDEALSTGERAGRLLRELLTGVAEYRRMWESRVRRASAQQPSFAAVARVIAEYLWNAGIVAEEDQELDRALKDRVSRALGGGRISAQTMEWFIEAFGMRRHEAGLWAAFAGLTDPGTDASSGTTRGGPARSMP